MGTSVHDDVPLPSLSLHVARVMPAAMLFVPSINGIKPPLRREHLRRDIVLDARIFTDAIASVLMRCLQRSAPPRRPEEGRSAARLRLRRARPADRVR
jgi:hypothetical protein